MAVTRVGSELRVELARDEQLRNVQDEEKRYQIAKDLADNLTVSYNTSEVIMARLKQTTNAKERVYHQAISFFGTNESVFTALTASFTGLFGLHESTQTLEAMKEGVSKSLEDLADIGGKVQEEAIKAQWAEVQNQYQRRADLVPNLVATVKGYAAQEKDVLTAVTAARASATQVKVDASTITDPAQFQKFAAAQDQLGHLTGIEAAGVLAARHVAAGHRAHLDAVGRQ